MTERSDHTLTIADVERMSEDKLLLFLQRSWGLEVPVLVGRLTYYTGKFGGGYYALDSVCGPDMQPLQYPLSDYVRSTRVDRVYVGTVEPALVGAFVRVAFCMSPVEERRKRNNPFLISAVRGSLARYEKLNFLDVMKNPDGSVLVEGTVKQEYLRKNRSRLEEELRTLEEQVRSKLEAELRQLKDQVKNLDTERTDLTRSVTSLSEEATSLKGKVASLNDDVASLTDCLQQLVKEERDMTDTIERLTEFVRQRADRLKAFDFITEEQYRNLTDDGGSPTLPDVPYLDFESDIKGDFSELIATIQGYLHAKDILYPRYLLTDFLTLLRTNDFIVMAGLSGSGKTQLVKAFAEATCGVAHIIAVKPNWTGAEDLLGYYNPIQRAYLTTPFLEALIQAKNDPGRLHLICLDEMNLARVEYYFADFLSSLETRDTAPKISLYSSDESDHVFSEFTAFLNLVDEVLASQPEITIESFGQLMSHETLNKRLQELLGTGEKEHLIGLHNRLRRLVSGVLNVPAGFSLPPNVRILGTVNFDETTHYLAPKVLDRAHVLRFISPLEYDTELIDQEVSSARTSLVRLTPSDLKAERGQYPRFDKGDFVADTLVRWRRDFLAPLGVDIGLRTIRQALHYRNLYLEAIPKGSEEDGERAALNNITLHKLLPRFSFDGRTKLEASSAQRTASVGASDATKQTLVATFGIAVQEAVRSGTLSSDIYQVPNLNAVTEVERLVTGAENNDLVFNYWS